MLTDQWPYTNLCPEEHHIMWMFSPTTDILFNLAVLHANDPPRHFTIHLNTFLILACFELEYWQTMDMIDDNMATPKIQMSKRYMQTLRLGTVQELSSASEVELTTGKWDLGILKEWSIRTWKGYTHSDWGRQKYVQSCQQTGLLPYKEQIKNRGKVYTKHGINWTLFKQNVFVFSDWNAYFRMQNKKYVSHGYNEFHANLKRMDDRSHEGSSAFDLLKSLHLIWDWPKLKLDDIRRGLNDEQLLIEREKQVCWSHAEPQQTCLSHLGVQVCDRHAIHDIPISRFQRIYGRRSS